MKKFKDYFQDKKVFITGHTGFKGTWLTKYLLNFDADIIGFSDKIPTTPSMFEILGLESYITHIKGDVRNFDKLSNSILKFNPDVIIHLAAQPLVRRSYLEPMETYKTNVIGTVNLLESIKNLNRTHNNESKVLLNVTSDKCNENKEQNNAYNENYPL
jgi:CDP-glucose 4,6-dehydratase